VRLLRSLSFRFTLQYMALFLGSVLVLGGIHYMNTLHKPLRRVERQVQQEAQGLADTYRDGGQAALVSSLQYRQRSGGARLPFHTFLAPGGKRVSGNLPRWPAAHAGGWLRLDADTHADGEDQDHEALVRDVLFADGARLLVGRDIEDIDELEEKLLSVLIGVVGSAIALGLIGGLFMSHVIGRRIAHVTRTARSVMAGDLSGRIPTRGSDDDFDRLSATLNEMLARTEQLVEAVRRVSDSVAHELRTPLARLRADMEPMRFAKVPPSPEQVELVFAELEKLEKTFDAVLRISRIESRRHDAVASQVDLPGLIADAADLYMPEAEHRRQTLQVNSSAGAVVWGDRDLLFQSVCNLLDNAIKYSPLGGVITVSARNIGAAVELRVVDSGPGISAEHLPHVAERFYRVPETAAAPGAGLGLSLVAAVAEKHDSTLCFERAEPGLSVRWVFPVNARARSHTG
jgi:signal transduction histidine kinase